MSYEMHIQGGILSQESFNLVKEFFVFTNSAYKITNKKHKLYKKIISLIKSHSLCASLPLNILLSCDAYFSPFVHHPRPLHPHPTLPPVL